MNIWMRGPVTQNPYVRTAFRVAMLPREVVRRPSLVKRIAASRNLVAAAPGTNSIRGVPVTLEEMSAAETTLLKPEDRILEELLVHETESRDLRKVRALLAEVREAMSVPDDAPVSVRPDALRPFVRELEKQAFDQLPAVESGLGSLETGITPPFGETKEVQ